MSGKLKYLCVSRQGLVNEFETAQQVEAFLWGRDLRYWSIYKRVMPIINGKIKTCLEKFGTVEVAE